MKSKIVLLGLVCVLLALSATSAFAAGTPAGTKIKNVASMTYKDLSGGDFPTVYSDTAEVTVEQVPGVTLTPAGSLKYSSDSMYVYFPHIVTNTGNGTDSYNISTADSASWNATIFYDANGNGILDVGENTTVSTISNLAADAQYKIIVRLFVPHGTPSNVLDTIRTYVSSTFSDTAGVQYDTAKAWVRDSIKTRTADVGLTKTNNNGTPQPGDVITYTINYSNSGSGSAKNAFLYDTLDVNVTYVASSATVVSGGGSVTYNPTYRRVEWTNIGDNGSIYGSMTGQMTFQVTVNDSVPAGTVISNRAYMDYTDSISNRREKPPGGPTTSTVQQKASWDLKVANIGKVFTTDNDADSVNVSQAIYYKIKLTNRGNKTDTATISRTSSLPLTWTLFKDVNKNGVYDNGTDTPFDLAGNTGAIAQNDSMLFIAVDTVLQNVADRSRDSATYIVSSITVTAKDTGWTITRIKAPVMTLTKAVQGKTNGRTRPGDTLVYTITYTNTGSGQANQIVISDVSPNNTSYIANSVQVKNSSTGNVFVSRQDDGSDSAAGSTVSVSSGTVTVNVGNVGPRLLNDASYTGQIKFMVKIN